MTQLAIFVLNQ